MNTAMMTTVSTEHNQAPYTIIHSHLQFDYGECDCCEKPIDKKEYLPIFGVGGMIETSIWAAQARPIKLTDHAINYYNLDPEFDSKKIPRIQPRPSWIIGQTVGVVRRLVVNGEKIEIYHCPKYELVSIDLPHMYNLCTAKVKCYNTGEIEDVVIQRIAIPKLLEYN
jgi:hypothetical protein